MANIEDVAGKRVRILFEGRRCIHARNCVLGRPDVFVPNVEGEWIHPDAATPEEIAALAQNCPSGAIQYERLDGGAPEPAPRVNLVRIRENGPLAIHAPMEIDGVSVGLRATLCRCGASKNKPFCDGSHTAAGFAASGEPAAVESQALATRDGVVKINAAVDGPLLVEGAVEVVSGTGRTVNRATKMALCRCGGSANKPYCDGTHRTNGFRS
jgi:CDGSH-type Zn-finger protein/uncharacterized Fe-S cluster protein YjdI